MSIMYPSPLFLAVGLATFNCIWFTGPTSVTERASDDQCLGSLDDTVFVAKLSRVWNWPDWGRNYSVASFSCFHELQCTENRWHVYGELSFFNHSIFSLHLCKEYLTAVKMKNTFLTPHTVLNVLCMDCSASIKSNMLENAWSVRNMWTVNNG